MTDNPLALPPPFQQTIRDVFGDQVGGAWLNGLPALLGNIAQRWSLTLLPAFDNLSFNYVAPVRRSDGTEAVLKAGVPHPELFSEIATLRVCDGEGYVRILEADEAQGVFLMERIRPGTVLTTLADEAHDAQATAIAADVMQRLWRTVPDDHGFVTVAEWAAGLSRLRVRFDGGTGPLPVSLVERAETLFRELLASTSENRLLHGDLHHDNILAAERAPWLAIDPKGVVGDPAFEPSALLLNFWEDRHTLPNPVRVTERRLQILADRLGMEAVRIRDWAIARSVLSAWWCIEDNMDCWTSGVDAVQILDSAWID